MAKSKSTPKPAAKKSVKEQSAGRPIKYPTPDARLATITQTQMKEILGWEELENEDESCVPELKSLLGKNIRLANNIANRFLTLDAILSLKQEILQRRWRFNGESIVIGQTDLVLSGQHRGLGLILACIAWAESDHWKENWSTEPTLESLIVYGVDESDDTFKTLNCGKPATATEVLYRSHWFTKEAPSARKELAKITDYAVKLLWDRTGAKDDAYAPRRTHGELMDFLDRHPTVIKCVRHIYEENKGNSAISGQEGLRIATGTAAGLCYLMATSGSDGDKYRAVECSKRAESALKFGAKIPPREGRDPESFLDRAKDFWAYLVSQNPELKEVKYALKSLYGADGDHTPTFAEKCSVVVKGWNAWINHPKITPSMVKLKFATKEEDGVTVSWLDEYPMMNGIDTLKSPEEIKDKEDAQETEEATEKKKTSAAQRAADLKASRVAHANGDAPAPGEVAKPEPVEYDGDGKPPAPKLISRPTPKPKPKTPEPIAAEASA